MQQNPLCKVGVVQPSRFVPAVAAVLVVARDEDDADRSSGQLVDDLIEPRLPRLYHPGASVIEDVLEVAPQLGGKLRTLLGVLPSVAEKDAFLALGRRGEVGYSSISIADPLGLTADGIQVFHESLAQVVQGSPRDDVLAIADFEPSEQHVLDDRSRRGIQVGWELMPKPQQRDELAVQESNDGSGVRGRGVNDDPIAASQLGKVARISLRRPGKQDRLYGAIPQEVGD